MSRAQIRTTAVGGGRRRYLGTLGTLAGTGYSFSTPGGCLQASWTVQCDPIMRTDALDEGRYVEISLGGGVVWDGKLDEPQQVDGGWSCTAQGSGTFGSLFDADYTGSWPSAMPDQVIADANTRGLGWIDSSIGHPSGIFLGQAPDPGSIMVDEMLNQATQLGGLTWTVKRTPRGLLPQMWTLPTKPNRLLVSAVPAPRTLGGDYNAIKFRYQVSADGGAGNSAVYATAWVLDQASIDKHGRREFYYDLSSVGNLLLADVQAIGARVLARYQRATFAGPYQVQPGQLLTLGGQAQDLGVYFMGNEGPMVCKLLLTDEGFGGEVNVGPVTFMTGLYEYDVDNDTATITPFQSTRQDFTALLDSVAARVHGRPVPRRQRRRRPGRGHLVSVHSHQPPGRGRRMHRG